MFRCDEWCSISHRYELLMCSIAIYITKIVILGGCALSLSHIQLYLIRRNGTQTASRLCRNTTALEIFHCTRFNRWNLTHSCPAPFNGIETSKLCHIVANGNAVYVTTSHSHVFIIKLVCLSFVFWDLVEAQL